METPLSFDARYLSHCPPHPHVGPLQSALDNSCAQKLTCVAIVTRLHPITGVETTALFFTDSPGDGWGATGQPVLALDGSTDIGAWSIQGWGETGGKQ